MLGIHLHTYTLLISDVVVPLCEETKEMSCYRRAFVLSEMGLYVQLYIHNVYIYFYKICMNYTFL